MCHVLTEGKCEKMTVPLLNWLLLCDEQGRSYMLVQECNVPEYS